MLDAITSTQIALLQDQYRLQSISQDISNMQTPGYKKQFVTAVAFDELVSVNAMAVNQQLRLDQSNVQGTFNQSNRPTDLALAGDGYFEVQTSEGIYYTRRGDFIVNSHGELATATGAVLLGKGGAIRVDDNQFTIDSQGTVIIDSQKVEQLNLVKFNGPKQLDYQGEGLFAANQSPLADSSTRVLQGYLEQSNIKSSDAMLEMVQTARHFESAQRVMRTADSLLATGINQLGEGNV
ncbi:flagellar hook-basal body protein [Legionella dresdenensis]|uniref:Flagellar hook-basal body protein n=1 Tax=Legionella dresdenensis TaxID=450200 RepID=A0ABV8CHA6_9GAMM